MQMQRREQPRQIPPELPFRTLQNAGGVLEIRLTGRLRKVLEITPERLQRIALGIDFEPGTHAHSPKERYRRVSVS